MDSHAAFAFLLGFVALAFLTGGFPSRLPAYLQSVKRARSTSTPRDECFRDTNSVKKTPETYCSFGSDEAAGRASAILGDSFVNQYLEPISSAALANRIHRLIATQAACRAFIDDSVENSGIRRRAGNSIAARGVRAGSGYTRHRCAQQSRCARGVGLDWQYFLPAKTVVLIMPLLELGFDLPQRWVENQIRAGKAIDEWKFEAGLGLMMTSLRDGFAEILRQHRYNPGWSRWSRRR